MAIKMEIKDEKRSLRLKIKKELRTWISQTPRKNLEIQKEDFTLTLEHLPKSSTIAAYIPLPEEPNILNLIKNHLEYQWVFPLIENQLNNTPNMSFFLVPSNLLSFPEKWQRPSKHYPTLLEPNPQFCTKVSDLDLVAAFIPGLAFDKNGNRLGRGAGYYDFFLNRNLNFKKIGVCYRLQLLEKIPIEKHDQKMDIILTEKKLFIACNSNKNPPEKL